MKVSQIIAGIVAGIAGAAAWAAIAFFAGINSGIVAWGIGALVGFAIAATGRSGKLPGVVAVIITIVAILAGKYGSSELAMLRVHRINQEAMTDLDEDIDKAVITARAHRLAEQRMKEGEELIWPEGMALEDAEEPEDFPHELWSEVRQEWEAKSEAERDALRKEHIENVKEAFAMLHGVFKGMNNAFFWASFGWRDMLYFGVAIFTVWWIAGRSDDEAGDEWRRQAFPPHPRRSPPLRSPTRLPTRTSVVVILSHVGGFLPAIAGIALLLYTEQFAILRHPWVLFLHFVED